MNPFDAVGSEGDMRRGTFAERTGQAKRAAIGAGLASVGGIVLLVSAAARSPWGERLGISTDMAFEFVLVSLVLTAAGVAVRWFGIRCPRCQTSVYWRHLVSQPAFQKDTSDPDKYGCPECRYQPK